MQKELREIDVGKLQKDDEPVVKGAPFSKDVGWDKRWYEGPESELKIDGQREGDSIQPQYNCRESQQDLF